MKTRRTEAAIKARMEKTAEKWNFVKALFTVYPEMPATVVEQCTLAKFGSGINSIDVEKLRPAGVTPDRKKTTTRKTTSNPSIKDIVPWLKNTLSGYTDPVQLIASGDGRGHATVKMKKFVEEDL